MKLILIHCSSYSGLAEVGSKVLRKVSAKMLSTLRNVCFVDVPLGWKPPEKRLKDAGAFRLLCSTTFLYAQRQPAYFPTFSFQISIFSSFTF